MRSLVSISEVIKKYKTNGSRPILVLADDVEHYICKYPFFPNDSKLINEYLANRFAQAWGIEVPEMAFVTVLRDHIPEGMLGDGLNYNNLEKPLVGFKQISDVTEFMDKISEGISFAELKRYNKKAFLLIVLFDIWLSNDDRNINNTNILKKLVKNKVVPIAIDHEKVFNTGNLERDIYELAYEDSLFYSNLYHLIFKRSLITIELVKEVCATLTANVKVCHNQLDDILNDIPDEWNMDLNQLKGKLERNIFTSSWMKKVEVTFRRFASLAIRRS